MTVYMRDLGAYAMSDANLEAHWAAVTVCVPGFIPWNVMAFCVAQLTEAVDAGIVFG